MVQTPTPEQLPHPCPTGVLGLVSEGMSHR